MSGLLRPFRRLRWQLTLFYILITLVATLTLEAATSVANFFAPKAALATPAAILLNAMSFTEAPQIGPYLAQNPPDEHALGAWVGIWKQGFTFSKMGFSASPASAPDWAAHIPSGSYGARDVTIVVTDQHGQPVVSASDAQSSFTALVTSQPVQNILRTALSSDPKRAPTLQTATLADRRTIAATPVLAIVGGPILGALLVIATIVDGPPEAESPAITQFVATFKSVLPTTLALVILACVVGVLFGVLASRGITRRLRGITLAADAWSQGQFETTIPDTRDDELGMLAADLNSMAEQLQRLVSARQELAVVEERHRLARDLHDSVKQQTFVITMLLGAARNLVAGNGDAERMLVDAEQLVGQTQQELTALIRALRPAALPSKDLRGTLQTLCDDWAQRTGIRIQFDATNDAPLAPTAQQELALVAQEALTNIARHSGATVVQLRVGFERASVALSIQDNGHGFDLDQVSSQGLGLSSMRERVEALGGTLRMSSDARGTRIEAHIPVEATR